MNIDGKAYRTIWLGGDGRSVEIIDQTRLPHELAIVTLRTLEDAARAIKTMQVRGAPLIGATAAYGVCLALRADASDEALDVYMLREISTGQHSSGTCKMGPASDPMAVVDQYGKVHGIDGLRVVDASIMPDCIRANTNVTTMMIGERIADFIKAGK